VQKARVKELGGRIYTIAKREGSGPEPPSKRQPLRVPASSSTSRGQHPWLTLSYPRFRKSPPKT